MIGRRRGLASSSNPKAEPARKKWKSQLASGDSSEGEQPGTDPTASAAGRVSWLEEALEEAGGGAVAETAAADEQAAVGSAGDGSVSDGGAVDGSIGDGCDRDGGAGGGSPAAESVGDDLPTEKKPKKEKAFAWMDSDDDGDGDEEAEEETAGAADKAVHGAADPSAPAAEEAAPLHERLMEVQTLSEFLRLAPALMSAAAAMPAEHLAILCATAARMKFFDPELFGHVFAALKVRFIANEVSTADATAIAQQLTDLNAYDRDLFTVAAASLQPRIHELNKELEQFRGREAETQAAQQELERQLQEARAEAQSRRQLTAALEKEREELRDRLVVVSGGTVERNNELREKSLVERHTVEGGQVVERHTIEGGKEVERHTVEGGKMVEKTIVEGGKERHTVETHREVIREVESAASTAALSQSAAFMAEASAAMERRLQGTERRLEDNERARQAEAEEKGRLAEQLSQAMRQNEELQAKLNSALAPKEEPAPAPEEPTDFSKILDGWLTTLEDAGTQDKPAEDSKASSGSFDSWFSKLFRRTPA